MTSTTSSGWAWDVIRLKFSTELGEYPAANCEIITSADCCPWYEGANAFADDRRLWGGRKSDGIFFIGIRCPVPDMPIVKVQVLQGGGHFASTVTVQRLAAGSEKWTDVTVATNVKTSELVTLYQAPGGCCQRSAHDDRCAFWEYPHGKCIVLEARTIGCNRAVWVEDKIYDNHLGRCVGVRRLESSTSEDSVGVRARTPASSNEIILL